MMPDATVSTSTDMSQTKSISEDEVALYDRQIRLWGFQAQEHIRNANVLLVNIRALGNEIAKNLVLAGISSLTIIDNAHVIEEDLGSQFLIGEEDVGKLRVEVASSSLRKLNPRVKIVPLPLDPSTAKPDLFQSYTLVIATDLPATILNTINSATALGRTPFYAGGSHGLYGFTFADLILHDFAVERPAPNVRAAPASRETPTRTVLSSTLSAKDGKPMELVRKREEYQPFILINTAPLPTAMRGSPRRLRKAPPLLPCLRALWEYESATGGLVPSVESPQNVAAFTQLAQEKAKDLQMPPGLLTEDFARGFLRNSFAELAPTCAFLGGALAQDVINVIGKREQPLQNTMLFDGEEGRSDVLALIPEVRVER